MSNTKERKRLVGSDSAVMAFLSGKGPGPLPPRKRSGPGPLESAFLDSVDDHIAQQDRENNARPERGWEDTVMAMLRLRIDNKEMIRLIKSGSCDSVSDLANRLGRELSNVSRTLSKLAAYGMVGYERAEEGRAKKPVWLLPIAESGSDMEWIEAFCVLKAMRPGFTASVSDPQRFKKLEAAVSAVVRAASTALDKADPAMPSSKPVKRRAA